MKYPLKGFYIVLSVIFLGLGVLGALLPMLPTTPFVLASSYFAVKGSDRLHRWIVGTKFYKNNLESFATSRTMSKESKIRILGLASAMMTWAFFAMKSPIMRGVLVVLVIIKYYVFICVIKTEPKKVEAYD